MHNSHIHLMKAYKCEFDPFCVYYNIISFKAA